MADAGAAAAVRALSLLTGLPLETGLACAGGVDAHDADALAMAAAVVGARGALASVALPAELTGALAIDARAMSGAAVHGAAREVAAGTVPAGRTEAGAVGALPSMQAATLGARHLIACRTGPAVLALALVVGATGAMTAA